MLAGGERGFSQAKMVADRCRDRDGIRFRIIDHFRGVSVRLDIGIECAQVPQAILVYVANRLQPTTGKGFEIAHQVRTPVTTTDYRYVDG